MTTLMSGVSSIVTFSKRTESMSTSLIVAKNKPSTSQSVSKQQPVSLFRKRRKQEIEERTEQPAILMVVLNAITNFSLRIPELLVSFSISQALFGSNIFYQFINSFPRLPQSITDLAYFCYILTFTTNFFIYYLFNQKFKQTFSRWTHVKPK